MTRSQRMAPLLGLRRTRQDDLAREVARQQQSVEQQESRLEMLKTYAAEYAGLPKQGAAIATTPAMLASRMAFRDKLDQAVNQQAQIVANSQQQHELEKARLLIASRETKVMEKLIASYRSDEAMKEAKAQQRQLDDLAARSRGGRV
ncbi:MAG: flagellar export protein FliJ [Pseudomonadota bacterium]|nr:flagellar export protein FliJ [Pseudomonadota bacterium]